MAAWILVIGRSTNQWWTHLVESLPVWLLLLCPRRAWTRAMMSVVAFSWIFMLVTMTPEFRDSLNDWNPFQLRCWLAPVMVTLSLLSMYLNLSILRRSNLRAVSFIAAGVLLVSALYGLNLVLMELLLEPLQKVVAGQYIWAAAIAVPSFLSAAAALLAIKWWTGHPHLIISRKSGIALATFWAFFVGTMIVSQLPGIKNY